MLASMMENELPKLIDRQSRLEMATLEGDRLLRLKLESSIQMLEDNLLPSAARLHMLEKWRNDLHHIEKEQSVAINSAVELRFFHFATVF